MKRIRPFLAISFLFLFFLSGAGHEMKTALGQTGEIRSSNVEFNALAIDEDRCPGVLVFPGTKSGSYNAYYYLVKPYPKMNIDFEDVAYIPSFKKVGDGRSFYYAFYFPSYGETNPFDDYTDIPCSKDQLKREIVKTLPASEKPKPEDINLARLKVNTIGFSIPKYYRDRGYELIYDDALSDSQNAGVIYSRGTFILELKVPENDFEGLLSVLRSEVGFPLSIKMGFKAKEQLDYKEVFVDVGSMLYELKAKLGGKAQYISEAKLSAAVKSTSSFANIQIYGETTNIDQWITSVLVPFLAAYTTSGLKGQTQPSPTQPVTPQPYNPYVPYPIPSPSNPSPSNPSPQNPGSGSGTPALGNNQVYIDLSSDFSSDVKKFTFKSDVLNPNASQEYLVYQYPLRYFGEMDGNYFVLESNRYEETERYSQIDLKAGENVEFSIEGYWKVTPKLVRHQMYYTKDHLEAGELPEIFTRNAPAFKWDPKDEELFVYGINPFFPIRIGGQSINSYAKFGSVKLEPVSWGNGYFPKYFNWTPVFPPTEPYSETEKTKLGKSLRGTNLFDIKVPVNNLRSYSIKQLLNMIPLGIRFWKGKSIDKIFALSEPGSQYFQDNFDEDIDSYFTIGFSKARRTVILTAKRDGHLYFENLDFIEPKLELRAKDETDTSSDLSCGSACKYISEDDFIKVEERLFKQIERKNYAQIKDFAGKVSKSGQYSEASKPLQYDFKHLYMPTLSERLYGGAKITREVFYPLDNPEVEMRTYIKLKIFEK
jgi:hypothetical protein